MPDPSSEPDSAMAIQAYYRRDEERDRLAEGDGLLEFVRTVDVIERTFPAAPALVADIGGGPGRYVDWLVERGHRVVHRDIVPGHVDQVRARHGRGSVDSAVGDARCLDLDDASVHAVLLLGPLYHLLTVKDRVQALTEARRVVEPGGRVYAAAISRSALRFEVRVRRRLHVHMPAMSDMLAHAERTGVMAPVTEDSFSGYAHTPEQLAGEVADSGLRCHGVVPVEGAAFLLPDLDDRLADPALRQELLQDLSITERAPDLAGLTLHLLALAQRL